MFLMETALSQTWRESLSVIAQGDGSAYLYNEQFDDSSCLCGVTYVVLHDHGRSKRLLNFSLARIPKQHHIFERVTLVFMTQKMGL